LDEENDHLAGRVEPAPEGHTVIRSEDRSPCLEEGKVGRPEEDIHELLAVDSCTGVGHEVQQVQGVVREHHRAWVVLLRGDNDHCGHRADQQPELEQHSAHRRHLPERKPLGTRPDGRDIVG